MVEDETLYEEEEHIPYYGQMFLGSPHYTFGGDSETHGPVVLSLKPAKNLLIRDPGSHTLVRGAAYVMIHTVVGDERIIIPYRESMGSASVRKALLKSFRKYCSRFDDVNFVRLEGEALERSLFDFEKHYISCTFKFGVLLCLSGQSENDMFCNQVETEKFREFLQFLGDEVELMGWERFRGGLDVKANTTGVRSVFTVFRGYEVMFHVSTMLPHDKADPQQLEKKRHIGNDVVVVVFIESEEEGWRWEAEGMCSQVNQVGGVG